MGTASKKGPAGSGGAATGQSPSLLDATPAERLDWLEGALKEAYESSALSRPTASKEKHPLLAAAPPATATKRKRRKKPGDPAIPRDLERAGSLALAFVNAGLLRRDDRRKDKRAPPARPLATYSDAIRWALRMGVVTAVVGEALEAAAKEGRRDTAAAFADLGVLRDAMQGIFTAVALKREIPAEVLGTLNRFLRRRGREVFPRGDGFRRDWGGDPADLERLIWPLAESAAELLASKKLSRVRQCAAKGCLRLFVVGNPRRSWCDANTCGSRNKGRRYMDKWRRADTAAGKKTLKEAKAERQRDREALEEQRKKQRALMKELGASTPGKAR